MAAPTIIAFDVSKDELVGVRTNKHGVEKECYAIPNTPKRIDEFLSFVKSIYPKLVVGSEATAEYHRSLAETALQYGIPFRLINPILTKQFTRATVRKKKTDLTDAAIIAKLIAQGEGSLVTAESFSALKTLSRTAASLMGLKKTIVLMARHVHMVVPKEKRAAVALGDTVSSLETTIKLLRRQVEESADEKQIRLLMSIPGIGKTLAAILLVEIGDVKRFHSPKSLVAYAGLDPKVRQSGKSLNHNTNITKRGSPHFRHAAYIAAYIAAKHDPELKEYFVKKKQEGRRYKEATVATARKIIYRIYAVLKRQTPYVIHQTQSEKES